MAWWASYRFTLTLRDDHVARAKAGSDPATDEQAVISELARVIDFSRHAGVVFPNRKIRGVCVATGAGRKIRVGSINRVGSRHSETSGIAPNANAIVAGIRHLTRVLVASARVRCMERNEQRCQRSAGGVIGKIGDRRGLEDKFQEIIVERYAFAHIADYSGW